MSYVSIKADRFGVDIRIPVQHADDPGWQEGSNELLTLALAHYNEAIEALEIQHPRSALAHIEQAVRAFPYAPIILDLAVALHLKHGHIERAHQLTQHLRMLGEHERVGGYTDAIRAAAQRWNTLLSEPELLLKEVSEPPRCYRELVFLVGQFPERLPPSMQDVAQQYDLTLSAPSRPAVPAAAGTPSDNAQSWRWATVGVTAIALILIGYITLSPVVADRSGNESEAASSTLASETSTPSSTALSAFERTGLSYLSGNASPEVAWNTLDSIATRPSITPAEEVARLRSLIVAEMHGDAEAAWARQDFDRLLYLLRDTGVAPLLATPADYYRLGLAASETGEVSTAIEALRRSLETNTTPYYEAEALYRLALLSEGDTSKAFAEEIVEKYSQSIYNNSKIAARLSQ